jgi:N-acetylglucosamine kinase-like BadF-type ATPase
VNAPDWVVAVDVGGTGARLVARPAGGRPTDAAAADGAAGLRLSGRAVRIGPGGSDAADVVADLAREAAGALAAAHPGARVAAAAVGATGLATLVPAPGALHDALTTVWPAARTAVAADALTAHLGALGGRPGAVVAAGTGAIALGTDLHRVWRRVDGWGHLLGDLGSGSWVGAHGLRAAVAAHDGLPGASPTLLHAALERFGPVPTWPAQLYPRPDRAQVLASFVPAVADAARAGDAVAARVLADAGERLAESLVAALAPGVPPLAAATGGLLAADGVAAALAARLRTLRPDVTLAPAAGTPLDGALRLAAALAAGTAPSPHEPWLTVRAPRAAGAASAPTPPQTPKEVPDGR